MVQKLFGAIIMSAHPSPHMSPAHAAQVANVSRWAIMRAIKSHKLEATRDNRNHWKISPDDLDVWCAHSVRIAHPAHPDESTELREKLASETARADAAERARDQAESDRDRWQRMAEKLADKPRRGWWWR
jgi:excisionase family DNA binding protein